MSIGLALATRGIPSDTEYDYAGDYEADPWRPKPNSEVIHITIEAADESKQADLVAFTPQGDTEDETT